MRRLSEMSMWELEQAGQRYYENLGRIHGEDGPDGDEEYDPDDELVADPADTLQPWEVEPRED